MQVKELLMRLLKSLKTNKTKKSILYFLLIAFSFLILLYPLSYGIVDLQGTIIFGFIIYIIYLICKKTKIKNRILIKEKYYIPIILFFAIITRVGIVILLNSSVSQVSDFGAALENAKSLIFSIEYYRVFTHWILYPCIVHLIMNVFSSTQLVALLTNSLILVINSILVYKVANKLFDKKKYGLIAALIYIFWPANIIYTLIFTQEHLAQTLILLAILSFFNIEKFNNKIINYINIVFIGMCLALSSFFKNFAPVILIAIIIYYILNLFTLKKQEVKKFVINKIIYIILIFISFITIKNCTYLFLDNLLGVPVARNITPCYLNVGLRDYGVYSQENYGMYFNSLRNNNYNYEVTNDKILNNLIKSFSEEDNKIFKEKDFFENKAILLFKGDSAKIDWVIESMKANYTTEHIEVLEDIKEYNNDYFVILVLLIMIGLVYMVKNMNLKYFFIYVIFYGCFLLLILVEAQNRYMYSIQPLMCILSMIGVKTIIEMRKKYEKVFRINKNKTLD